MSIGELILTLIGAGALGGIAGWLIRKGEDRQRLKQLEKKMYDIECRQEDCDDKFIAVDKEIAKIDRDTQIRLMNIETRLTGLELMSTEIQKDTKMLLRHFSINES